MNQLGQKLRALRKFRKVTLKQLAQKANCSPSYLSMVESGKVDPGISRLKRIVEGLEMTIIDLFKTDSGQKVVIKKNERIHADFPGSKTRIEILIPQWTEKQMDARLAIISPGGSSEGDYQHPGAEFGLILEGILELSIDGLVYSLTEGDSFYFSSARNHRFKNPGKKETVVVWVNTPPSW